jgi:hypothetical protein
VGRRLEYPGGARFAFTIFDDTDDGTLENLRPIYDLLERLGMRTTKTVWPFRHQGESNFFACETLEDDDYRDWVRGLQARGFEVSWHCATFESSLRARTSAGLDRFREVFGVSPRVHANHALNRENLYWGAARFDLPLLGRLFGLATGTPTDHYQGHVEGSPWWWGDLCGEHVSYGRNLTFDTLNLAKVNPSMPYHDPRRPLVPRWFSASDAESVHEFNLLTAPDRVDRLAAEGGFSIVATHLGKGFVRDGRVDPGTRRNLEHIAALGGWFPTTGELLDWLSARRPQPTLPHGEWRRMQLRFAWDLARRKLSGRFMGRAPSP